MHKRLSTSCYTATRTSHDFDYIKVFSLLHSLKHLLCIGQSADDCDLQRRIIIPDFKLLDAFVSSDTYLRYLCNSTSALLLHYISQDSFGNTACHSEYDTGSTLSVVRCINWFRSKIGKKDTRLPKHMGKLFGCNYSVDIGYSVLFELFPLGLELLCSTRHDRHMKQFFALLFPLFLYKGSEHLHRRAASGDVFQ